jgi:hypothetical protein
MLLALVSTIRLHHHMAWYSARQLTIPSSLLRPGDLTQTPAQGNLSVMARLRQRLLLRSGFFFAGTNFFVDAVQELWICT